MGHAFVCPDQRIAGWAKLDSTFRRLSLVISSTQFKYDATWLPLLIFGLNKINGISVLNFKCPVLDVI